MNESSEDEAEIGMMPPTKKARIDAVGQARRTDSTDGRVRKSTLVVTEKRKEPTYNNFAEKMMAKMGYKKGTGLGKAAQGRVEIVEASQQRGRRGLGLTVKGLEPSADVEWSEENDPVILEETVEWLPSCREPVPDLDTLRSWKIVGPKKRNIDDENKFCSDETLTDVLSSKSIFDTLEPEEMRKARTRSNPYETIRGVFFLNRAAMKMANMDAALNFMFTSPKYPDGRSMLGHNDILYFADVCAGPGGFSEYVLWRSKAEAKGFGLTLRKCNDFKLEDFFAGPPEMFEPHYGVGGAEGDGDIFRPDNQETFIKYVLENTDGLGVHFVMADGGFSVEGQENIQEILSKQLYLCQCLVAISIIRTGGHFVCKLFDLFTPFSVGLVYLMYRIFDKVSIFKPVTSRPANSERYIICQGLRPDKEPVQQYFHEINVDLNHYLSTFSKEDINEIVPHSLLQNDGPFFEYIYNSNDNLGELQIIGLKKIRAFTQNTNLMDTRQSDVRDKLLEIWKVDNKVRVAPPKKSPQEKCEELLKNEDSYFSHVTEQLSLENLRSIKSVYDYRCMVTGSLPDKRFYLLGLGRSHVFQQSCKMKGRWVKPEDGLRLELPRDTLIEAEIVTELRGEGTGQRKVTTIHALDALFLFGRDVRNLHFNDRIQKLRRFVKCITKLTRSDLVRIVVPEVYRFEQINHIFNRLELKKVKGGGPVERLCYCPREYTDGRFFRPTGIYIIRTVKEPWTMQWSKSKGRKYFFNLHKGQSDFDCPPDSIAKVRDTKLHSFHWVWEEGVKLLPGQPGPEDDSKLSKATVLEYLQRIMPHT
ncbi:cap-specific mRNA (nucleoside-2'-O-)-methyltransferase 1-like [Mya arenaria]|uniref:cap-specific mRNA (nucleoside-2'-O-)-methyltransferase 1-like n=1 Tax=Mya arenaria TaxID=6604 RepID=UPI0022E15D46|nr:cap-specific mRNA (nucleoside-2'-O-)-methyltransferase 1-like [Mya arenaria]XP_052769832.1 cap-specific mRNA (nucleoside-2'-O-)-methyltransferase 1-like [Mya arenaria]